jgi:LDH2 family malate/lactate/ureidoglycolate dehydrogenase
MKIEPVALERWVAQLLRACGTQAAKADRVAAALVEADRCGQSSHGVRQLAYYVDEIASGALLVDADPVVVDRRGGLTVVDGRHGFGQLVGEYATDLALDAAATHAVSAVAARNAGHIGRLGAYTQRIAQTGMVGVLLVNFQGGDQLLAPYGALERRLGNNPVSIGVPGPAVLDIALSVAAEGRVAQAHERGEMLPDGWIMDAEGAPSCDPADYLSGGSLLPMGGHKGYGLIVLVEMVVGLLALGGMCGPGDRSFSNAFVLVCLDPGDEGRAEYLRQLPGFVEWVKSARRLPGTTEILLPGELEQRRRSAAEVLHLDAPTSAACAELARRAGIPAPGA